MKSVFFNFLAKKLYRVLTETATSVWKLAIVTAEENKKLEYTGKDAQAQKIKKTTPEFVFINFIDKLKNMDPDKKYREGDVREMLREHIEEFLKKETDLPTYIQSAIVQTIKLNWSHLAPVLMNEEQFRYPLFGFFRDALVEFGRCIVMNPQILEPSTTQESNVQKQKRLGMCLEQVNLSVVSVLEEKILQHLPLLESSFADLETEPTVPEDPEDMELEDPELEDPEVDPGLDIDNPDLQSEIEDVEFNDPLPPGPSGPSGPPGPSAGYPTGPPSFPSPASPVDDLDFASFEKELADISAVPARPGDPSIGTHTYQDGRLRKNYKQFFN